jgi:copper(I)-binding protein
MKTILTLTLSLFLILVSCQQNETEQAVNEKSLIISDTWMRPGSLNRNTAAFMKITNNMNVDDTLYAVSSDLAKAVEIHETYKKDNDMMGMRHIDYLVIPKNSTVELKPGSFHIMFIGLNKDLAIDENISLKLFFKVNGEIEIDTKAKQNQM